MIEKTSNNGAVSVVVLSILAEVDADPCFNYANDCGGREREVTWRLGQKLLRLAKPEIFVGTLRTSNQRFYTFSLYGLLFLLGR